MPSYVHHSFQFASTDPRHKTLTHDHRELIMILWETIVFWWRFTTLSGEVASASTQPQLPDNQESNFRLTIKDTSYIISLFSVYKTFNYQNGKKCQNFYFDQIFCLCHPTNSVKASSFKFLSVFNVWSKYSFQHEWGIIEEFIEEIIVHGHGVFIAWRKQFPRIGGLVDLYLAAPWE